jgi:hypothetical protein
MAARTVAMATEQKQQGSADIKPNVYFHCSNKVPFTTVDVRRDNVVTSTSLAVQF